MSELTLLDQFEALAWKKARREALEEVKRIAEREKSNTNLLLTHPPQSSAAFNIVWAIEKLIEDRE